MSAAINYVSLGMITVDSSKVYTFHGWLILYYTIAILTMTSLVGWLFRSGRIIAAGLTVVLLLIVYIFFALRWFANQKSTATTTSTSSCPGAPGSSSSSSSSIPIVNMCPDFMVAWTDTLTGNVYCYDDKNTYNMRTYNGAGLVNGLTINNIPGQSAYLIKNNSQNTGATNLSSDPNGLRWPFINLLSTNLALITGDKNGAFLRWEGVWDGSTLTVVNAPLP